MKEMKVERRKFEIHIQNCESFKMKDLVQYLDCIDKGFNDVNRKYLKIGNRSISRYSAELKRVKEGSIVLQIIVMVALPVTLNIIASAIYDRLKKSDSKSLTKKMITIEQKIIITDLKNNASKELVFEKILKSEYY